MAAIVIFDEHVHSLEHGGAVSKCTDKRSFQCNEWRQNVRSYLREIGCRNRAIKTLCARTLKGVWHKLTH